MEVSLSHRVSSLASSVSIITKKGMSSGEDLLKF